MTSLGCSLWAVGCYLPRLITPTQWGCLWTLLRWVGRREGESASWLRVSGVHVYPHQEYERALKYVRGLLQTEPQNNQAKELERLIDKAMKKGEPPPPHTPAYVPLTPPILPWLYS